MKLSSDVASFYGFRPVRTFEAGFMQEQKLLEPALTYYASPSPKFLPTHMPQRESGELGFSVIGSQGSVGEVVLIKTLAAIITEWGGTVARVRLNALGDRDSRARFARELSLYLRKNSSSIDATCREHISSDPLAAFTCATNVCREVVADAPRSMNFLSEKSRGHFREVLEHLEGLGLPYELDYSLVGDERDPRMVFAIDLEGEDHTVLGGTGGRYDDYLRKLTGKKEGSAVHASLFFRKKGAERAHFNVQAPTRRPKVYFIQLGTRAKLQGLEVVDMLRAARVPVAQSFDASRLSPQLEAAKAQGVSHILLMGQREALDGTLIVRSTKDSSQTILQLCNVPRFLKTLRA